MLVRASPLSKYAVPHELKVPLLGPPTYVAVTKTAPNPVAVPSQFTWERTLPAGPGVWVEVMALNENSPIALPAMARFLRVFEYQPTVTPVPSLRRTRGCPGVTGEESDTGRHNWVSGLRKLPSSAVQCVNPSRKGQLFLREKSCITERFRLRQVFLELPEILLQCEVQSEELHLAQTF